MAGGRPRYGSEILGSWPCSAPPTPSTRPATTWPGYDSNGLIQRRPGTNTYDQTPGGQRVAVFYTKVHDHLLTPLIAANQPPAPPDLRRALRVTDHHVNTYTDQARLGKAA